MKILYLHGFGSSGQSGTVKHIKEMLPEAEVVAPDLPIHPHEAMDLLHQVCEAENPDIIIGTSMGGMYAEQLRGYDRIIVNPALMMGDPIAGTHMLGKVTFQNPRRDGVQEFMMTKKLQEEYAEVSRQRFQGLTDEDRERVYGLFGLEDTIVDTFDLFAGQYPNAIRFHGEHRMNDSTLYKSVLPVVRWIQDRRQGRKKPTVFIRYENVMQRKGHALTSMAKNIRELSLLYDLYFVTDAPANDKDYDRNASEWIFEQLGVLSYNRIISINRLNFLYGDYLISDRNEKEFLGTSLDFSSEDLDSWDKILNFFQLLNGQ